MYVDKKALKRRERTEKGIEGIILLCAAIAVLCVVLITAFIFKEGLPAIVEIGFGDFIFGKEWKPTAGEPQFGIFPMIVGTVYSTFGAIVVGVPIGILTAVFIVEVAPKWLGDIVSPAAELLAGIPSVVYGFFGLVVIVPWIQRTFNTAAGNSLLAAIIILSIMILPTIISISENALRAVPQSYREASYGLGASKIETIFKVVLPAAKSGVLTSVILGTGRALGETMAVILVAGNSTAIPGSILAPARTLTANIALEMGYSYGLHREALFATGVVLFIFIMLLNITVMYITKKAGEK